MDVVEALRQLGGVVVYEELAGVCTEWQIRRAVTDGRIVRLRRNRYALVDTDVHVAAAVAAGGVVSHLSAATTWNWKLKHEPARPWVTLPRSRRRPVANLEIRWADIPDADITRHVTRPARTVVDCAKALPFDEALAVADSALRSGVVDRRQLVAALRRSSRNRRSKASEVIEAADPRAANPFESVVRALARDVPGLRVVPQVQIQRVGRVDLCDEELGIVIEAESHEFHSSPAGLRKDVNRYTECARQGLVVVRFVWGQAMNRPEEVRDALNDVVIRRRRELGLAA
ncbi:hypothetical protein [Nocardioides jishulii]|uniref:DUF559 domain-containing protein n=1 Tax=Nocardioides jishulii TaxID=2575440 RepID=A0A4V5TKH7_9ACTN|nr:hypothetical protein [Nocardioides jishulii]QCX26501.1 hypothetical protein FCL41_02275 [Nocardioides jishulii]TKI63693.1 hypothetical protein FC770_00430 [Nocardioides jishulii]